jgi:hypothetical protein
MNAFDALSELSKLGKKTKEVTVGELNILLSTLDAEQEGEVFVACAELTGNAYFYRLKKETLKYSIRAVNGQRLDDYENVKEQDKRDKLKKETLEKLSGILGTWDENVISFLYSKWAVLSKESEEDLKSKGILVE